MKKYLIIFTGFFDEKAMTSRCSIKLHILIDDNIDFFDFEIDTMSQGQSINEFILANQKLGLKRAKIFGYGS